MKITFLKHNQNQGSVLIVTLLICLILGILMGSYLTLVRTQRFSVARSQEWNRALIVAEAGVEEAMAHLNSDATLNNLAVNSWVNLGGGRFAKTNVLGDSYSVVNILTPPATTKTNPVIVSTSWVPGPLSSPPLTRTVQVETKPKPALGQAQAMVVTTTLDFSGFGVTTDSFDSTDPKYNTNGRYDPNKAKDNGDVSTLSGNTNAMTLGNGKVKGTIHTAAGGLAAVGSNGSVGDATWVDSGQLGVQTDHFKDDVNAVYPDPVLPPEPYWLPPMPGTYKINGANYKYVLNNSSPWFLPTLANSVYVNAPNVVLYVQKDIKISSKDQIVIAPGASLTVYMEGPSATIGGNGVINQTGQAKNFSYFGLPSNTYLDISANGDFVGTIYAPQADFSLGGGGKADYDFTGSSITRSTKMNGHFHFHYDESLAMVPASKGFVATSWDEL